MSFWQKVIVLSFCLLFIAVPLIFLSTTSELFEFNKIIVTYIFATIIGGAWLARMIAEKRWIFRPTLLDIPLLIFLASQLLSLLFSIDMHTSWYGYYSRWNGGVLTLLTYAFLYWAFVSNVTQKAIPTLIKCLLTTAGAVAIYAALEHFGHSPSCLFTRGSFGVDCWVQDVQNRVFATIGQPNWLAAYLVALIWLPISAVISKFDPPAGGRNSKQIFNLLIFIILFATVLFTKSRSGLLALGVSAIFYWGIYLIRLGKLEIRSIRNLLIFVTVTVTLTVLFPNPIRDLVIKSSAPAPKGPALEAGGTESGTIRKIVWTGAVRIWQGSPKNFLIGTGPETFAQAYYQFRPVDHNRTSEWELLYNKAHNEFLNYLATSGILGLGSYLVLLGTMGIVLWQKRKQELGLALFAGWLSISVTNFWGFSVIVVQLLLFLLPAIAIGQDTSDEKITAKEMAGGQKLALLGMAAVCLWLLWQSGRYWLADIKFASGTNAIKSFQATTQPAYLLAAYRDYTSAFGLNPAEPAITSEFSVSAAYLANSLSKSDATSAAQLAQIAIAASDKAIAISPHHPNYYKSRARAMILLSDMDSKYLKMAVEALEKAEQISPTDPRIPYNLGVVENYLGATPSAILNFKKALELKPDFADPQLQLDQLATFPAKSQ